VAPVTALSGGSGVPDQGLAEVTARMRGAVRGRVNAARVTQTFAAAVTGLITVSVIAVAFAILGVIVYRGIGAIDWTFLTAVPGPGMTTGGIGPVIAGTLWLVGVTALFALPIGILAGVYLAEYAPKTLSTRMIRLSITNMAGVPSIVYGLFGLALFVLAMNIGVSILAGALTLTCMTLPVVITATEEALRQIPTDLRHASLALGAGRWRTTYRVVLPAAAPGIMTGVILGLSRAAGETAPILFTAVAFFVPRYPNSVFSKVMALPYHVYALATQVPNPPESVVWGTALVLVGMVTIVSVIAASWRSAQRRKVKW
jgi:phosphate transport system permease protein